MSMYDASMSMLNTTAGYAKEFCTFALNTAVEMNPAANMIMTGITMTALGSYGLMKSGVTKALKGWVSSDKSEGSQKAPNYGLAAVSVASIAAGVAFTAQGCSQIYQQYFNQPKYELETGPGNMCTTTDLCKGNKGIPRNKMPQLNEKTTKAFLEKYPHTVKIMSSKDIIFTQGELATEKVQGLVNERNTGGFDACDTNKNIYIISEEGYLVDGHHRTAVCKLINQPVRVAQMNMAINPLLKAALEFEGVEKHPLHGMPLLVF